MYVFVVLCASLFKIRWRRAVKARQLLFAVLANIDFLVSGLCLIALVGLTTLGVVMRYVFNNPIIWLEEMQTLMFVWVAFFGSSVAFRSGNHIAIEALVDTFPLRWQRIVEVVSSVLVLLVLVLVMHWQYSRGNSLLRTGRTTSILGVPTALNYFGVACACAFMIVNFLVQRWRLFRSWRTGNSGDSESRETANG